MNNSAEYRVLRCYTLVRLIRKCILEGCKADEEKKIRLFFVRSAE